MKDVSFGRLGSGVGGRKIEKAFGKENERKRNGNASYQEEAGLQIKRGFQIAKANTVS